MIASNATSTSGVVGNVFEDDDNYQASADDGQVQRILRWGIVLAAVALMLILSVCVASFVLHRRKRIHGIAPHQWTASGSQDDQVTVAEDDSIVEENIKGTCSV